MLKRVAMLSFREKALSLFFILFFGFCLFQQMGAREDWPFSFFGMYEGLNSNYRIMRYDLDYIAPGKDPVSLYRRANGYYFMDKFMEIGNGRRLDFNNMVLEEGGDLTLNDDVVRKMRQVLVDDALPIADHEGFVDPTGRIRLRYRMWKDFQPEDISQPIRSVVILEPTLAELRAGK
jgi:hypothetical protein